MLVCKLDVVLDTAAGRGCNDRATRGPITASEGKRPGRGREAAGKPIQATLCLAIRVNLGLHLSRDSLLALPCRQYYFYTTNTCTKAPPAAAESHHKKYASRSSDIDQIHYLGLTCVRSNKGSRVWGRSSLKFIGLQSY